MENDDKFLLMSVNDENSKGLANAIANETSRKIISYLADKREATETQLAEDLKVPLTTIHYNIKLLLNAKLIQSKEFYWSKKGKEMALYKLSNKLIIIAPSKESESIIGKLKNLLPLTLISLIGSSLIYLYQRFYIKPIEVTKTGILTERITEGATDIAVNATVMQPNYALWFLLGSLFVILILFIFNLKKK